MKLSKKTIRELETIREFMLKAKKFIDSPETEVCTRLLPNDNSYYDKYDEGLTPVSKYTGSDLCYFYAAITRLNDILTRQDIK